ncbi:hypothetical protein FOXB_07426 [Fusarium oxysporum f. sp. conglutinans Fo5176]|uniref:Uncharacterized protein n=1 Tax=Fusarium oxysporum (strain Fo5176) TaxID=660025 RepID=F9FLZ6_FUSOF|nr:hypothetical protein FOXB_07426 [Fusarium oxysporum f. sp. conglutinans Fo5176]
MPRKGPIQQKSDSNFCSAASYSRSAAVKTESSGISELTINLMSELLDVILYQNNIV